MQRVPPKLNRDVSCPLTNRNSATRDAAMGWVLDRFGTAIARYLEKPLPGYEPFTPSDPDGLRAALRPGDPTRLICSALIAQAFELVRYPILPKVTRVESRSARREILEIRHSSLYAPRDFDISPYFAVVKPTLERGFDYKKVHWADLPPRSEAVAFDRPKHAVPVARPAWA